jgi:hypothetical protein
MVLTSLLNNLMCHFIYSHPLLGTSAAYDLSYQHQPCVCCNKSHTEPVMMNLTQRFLFLLPPVCYCLKFSILESWDHSHVLHLMAHRTTVLFNNLILIWLYLFIYLFDWSVRRLVTIFLCVYFCGPTQEVWQNFRYFTKLGKL